jgi:hypothetical protein
LPCRLAIPIAITLLWILPAQSQTFSCPKGSEDMLSYFVMAYPDRLTSFMGPGNANPIYTAVIPEDGDAYAESGYFVWMKSSSGHPWDVKIFDGNYVYDRTTELHWNDATTFKRFATDMKISPRCIPLNKAGKAIPVPVSGTDYKSYKNCKSFKLQNLDYALNTVSAPVLVKNVGNVGTVSTRKFDYQYGCDSNYSNCSDMEVFSLGLGIGLYDWKHYRNQSGKWKLARQSLIDEFKEGEATPYLPCANSYQ